MPHLDPSQVVLEARDERGGNGGEPVLVAVARPDSQWLHLNINVHDPEPDGCHGAPAAPVAKFGHQLGGSVQQRHDGGDCFASHDRGDVDLLVGVLGIDVPLQGVVENALVEEPQGIHGLVLCRGRDVSMHRQVGQE
jgi:hypothetical protein